MSDQQSARVGEKLLGAVRGARLTSVQFVLDYLILGFDEKGALTTLVWPEVLEQGVTLAFGSDGYRDALCALIGGVVENVTILGDETIVVRFQNEGELRIPLGARKGPGERAIFTAPNRVLFTW